ncbi:MAG: protease HtpX [Epsilonproteobacteria bacterium]|nr:protease HtpX [Campylobacterota bacterium]
MRIVLFLLTNFAVMALLLLTTKLLGLDQAMGQEYSSLLVFALIIGMGGSFVSLLLSKWMAKRSMGVEIIDPSNIRDKEIYWLYERVVQISHKAGIKTPEVGIYRGAPNAFATGWNRDDALVAVSSGLLEVMERDEIEGVLAHEIGHVANGDMVTLSLIQGVVNALVIFLARIIGSIVDKAIFKNRDGVGIGYHAMVFIAEMVLGVLASIIVMWFSRYREFRADEASASLVGMHKMVKALQKLQSMKSNPPLPKEMAAFGISGGGFASLFSSHPPLEDRINNLLRK